MEVNVNGNENANDEGLDFTWDISSEEKDDSIITQVNSADLEDDDILEGAEKKKTKEVKTSKVDESIFDDFSEDKETLVVEDEEEDDEDDDGEPVVKKKKVTKVTPKKEVTEEAGDEPADEDKEFFTTLAKELKQKGVFANVEISDDDEIDEDKFFDLQENEVDSRVEETFKGFFEDLNQDADAVNLIKFVKAGGSSSEFFRKFSNSSVISFPEDYDLDKKGNAAKLVKHYLMKEDGEDEEDALESIEILEEKGKLESRAATLHQKMLKKDKAEKEEMVTRAETAQNKAIQDNKTYREKLTKSLQELDEVNNIKFTAEDKKTLVDKITKPSIKVGENRYVTPLQYKISMLMKDPEKLFLLAKLVDKDLDTKDIVKDITTQQVKKVKSSLANIAKAGTKKLGNTAEKKRALADFFEE